MDYWRVREAKEKLGVAMAFGKLGYLMQTVVNL
jgi:hypothetical protein